MKRWITTLAATLAVLAATAGTAFGADPVQSATQSSATGQSALAASSATQVQPSNENISVRVLSPGNDGAVSQSNDASSAANAANTASTTQGASQTLASGCGCAVPGLESGQIANILPGALQAAGSDAATPATAPAATSTQANDASSAGTAANAAPTTQSTSQSAPGGAGVQSSQQDAGTDQTAQAASSAQQQQPSNSNISVRVLSPGDDGAVTQSNDAASSASAANSAATTQSGSQSGSGSGVQSSTQQADTAQKADGRSSATQIHPENSNVSVRILSPGNGGSVSQSNDAASSATARNDAPVTQTARQAGSGSLCGCSGSGPAVQSSGQTSTIGQLAGAASSATQVEPSNTSEPIRIGSAGDEGSLTQSNTAASSATTANSAPVTQSSSQSQAPVGCGCSSGPAVQAIGQSSEIGQLGGAFSSATQLGASNESGPVRIASYGSGGAVSQENDAASSASAADNAPTVQTGSQTQSGSGVQALGQKASTWQAGIAASSALQLPGRSACGCGTSSGNVSGPVRIASSGNDGALAQQNKAASSAVASNLAAPSQTATQTQAVPGCGCSGLGVQALGQLAGVEQLAAALSSATQVGAANASGPIRLWSGGGGGTTEQANAADSGSSAPNAARILQAGTQLMV